MADSLEKTSLCVAVMVFNIYLQKIMNLVILPSCRHANTKSESIVKILFLQTVVSVFIMKTFLTKLCGASKKLKERIYIKTLHYRCRVCWQ